MGKQLEYVFEHSIPFMIVIGENEMKNKTMQFKNIKTKEQKEMKLE
jgi:histidyl-tRNA synthetase